MEDNELKDFFWTPLFLVTGCSFLLFAGIISLINGPHVGTFLEIGLIGVGFGALSFFTGRAARTSPKEKGIHSR